MTPLNSVSPARPAPPNEDGRRRARRDAGAVTNPRSCGLQAVEAQGTGSRLDPASGLFDSLRSADANMLTLQEPTCTGAQTCGGHLAWSNSAWGH